MVRTPTTHKGKRQEPPHQGILGPKGCGWFVSGQLQRPPQSISVCYATPRYTALKATVLGYEPVCLCVLYVCACNVCRVMAVVAEGMSPLVMLFAVF